MPLTPRPVATGPDELPDPDRDAPVAERVAAATVACLAERGLRGSTLDAVADLAGCGRATIYRAFPGGRREVLLAAADHEIDRALAVAGVAADGAGDLGGAVTAAVVASARFLAGHAALDRLLAEDPGAVLPFVAFDGAGPLLARAGDWGRDHLARFVDPEVAAEVGEWSARVVLARLHHSHGRIDLTDEAVVERLVRTHLLPGLEPSPPSNPPSTP